MDTFLRIFLPFYFVLFTGIAFVLKTLLVSRKLGINPLVLPNDDSPYGIVGKYFKLTVLGIFLYIATISLFPALHLFNLPVSRPDYPLFSFAGIGIMMFALVWTIIAQVHMKDAWRIGINPEEKGELITNGLFGISRNPVFFGMMLSLLGLFLLKPNCPSLLFLLLGYVLIQIQVRFEEEYLQGVHGEKYIQYRNSVRRYI